MRWQESPPSLRVSSVAMTSAESGEPGTERQAARALGILEASPAFRGVAKGRVLDLAKCGRQRLFHTGVALMTQGEPSDMIGV